MTNAVPPTPAILNGPKSAAPAATNGDTDDAFAGTFRNQLDKAAPANGTRDSGAAPDPRVAGASNDGEAAAVTTRAPQPTVAGPDAVALDAEAVNLVEDLQLVLGPGAMTDPQAVVAPTPVMAEVMAAAPPLAAPLPAGADTLATTQVNVDGAEPGVAQALAAPVAGVAAAVHGVARDNLAQSSVQGKVQSKVQGNPQDTLAGLRAGQAPAIAAGMASDAMPGTTTIAEGGAEADLFAQSLARAGDAAVRVAAAPATAAVTGVHGAVPQSNSALASASASAAQLDVDTALADPDWGRAMGARLVWGAGQGLQSATIAINPRELGPVSVNLTVSDDETSVHFVSQHALVRDAIEAALPRLREMFSSEGITLGEVDISSGDGRPNNGGNAAADDDGQAHADGQALAGAAAAEDRVRTLDSLVDTFA